MTAFEYICDTCGERFYDDTRNSYTGDTYNIVNEAIKTQAIIHSIETKHHTFSIPSTNLKLNVG